MMPGKSHRLYCPATVGTVFPTLRIFHSAMKSAVIGTLFHPINTFAVPLANPFSAGQCLTMRLRIALSYGGPVQTAVFIVPTEGAHWFG